MEPAAALTYRPATEMPEARARGDSRTTVVLADQQHLVRHGLRCYLDSLKRYAVVAELGDSTTLPGVVARLRPQVVVADFELLPLPGPDVARVLRERVPQSAVVMMSRTANEAQAVLSLRNGAAAFVSKGAPPRELPEAIDAAAAGARYVGSPLSRRPLAYWLERAERNVLDIYETLGARERQVLHLVAQGLSSTAIARRLGIGARTVETHRERLKEKLGIHTHAGLIRYAVERQLFGLSERLHRL